MRSQAEIAKKAVEFRWGGRVAGDQRAKARGAVGARGPAGPSPPRLAGLCLKSKGRAISPLPGFQKNPAQHQTVHICKLWFLP